MLLCLCPVLQNGMVDIDVEALPPRAIGALYDLVVLGLRGARDSPFRTRMGEVGTGFSRRLRKLEILAESDWKGRWTWDMMSGPAPHSSLFLCPFRFEHGKPEGSYRFFCFPFVQPRQQNGYKRKGVAVVASNSPRASFVTLPVEIADMIVSLLTDREKSILGLVSFQYLQIVARTLFHSPKMSEREAIWFANARVSLPFPLLTRSHLLSTRSLLAFVLHLLHLLLLNQRLYASPTNRIRALLLPSTLRLQRVNWLVHFPSHLLVSYQGYSYLEGSSPLEMFSQDLIPLPKLNILTIDVASPDNELRYWSHLLYVLNPSSLQVTVGSEADRLIPPTITSVSRPHSLHGDLVGFAKKWNRLEEVVAVGPRSVFLLQGGSGNELAIGRCLESSRLALRRGPALYFQLETKRAGREVEEEWISKKSVGTRLARPPPALIGDESFCRLVMKG